MWRRFGLARRLHFSSGERLLLALVLAGLVFVALRWGELWPQVRDAFARYFGGAETL